MSVTGRKGIGLPIVLLYDAEGLVVSIETKNGDVYRGYLVQTEDNMNCHLRNVSHTNVQGSKNQLNEVYIRGKTIVYVIIPDFLSHSPMFKRVIKHKESKGRYVPQATGMERPGAAAPAPAAAPGWGGGRR